MLIMNCRCCPANDDGPGDEEKWNTVFGNIDRSVCPRTAAEDDDANPMMDVSLTSQCFSLLYLKVCLIDVCTFLALSPRLTTLILGALYKLLVKCCSTERWDIEWLANGDDARQFTDAPFYTLLSHLLSPFHSPFCCHRSFLPSPSLTPLFPLIQDTEHTV